MRAAATSTTISLLSPSRFRTSAPASLPYRRRPHIAAMAAAASSSFRPEAARLPAAVGTPTPPLSKFKVAMCQLSVTADKARNIARARTVIESAAADGAKLVLLPMQNNHSVVHPKESGECSPATLHLGHASRIRTTVWYNEWVRVARPARGGMRRHANRHEDVQVVANDSVWVAAPWVRPRRCNERAVAWHNVLPQDIGGAGGESRRVTRRGSRSNREQDDDDEHRKVAIAVFFFLSPPVVRGGAVGESPRASIPVHQGRARTGLDFAPIRRKGPRPYLPSGYVLGPVYLSNSGLLGPEKHHVASRSLEEEEHPANRSISPRRAEDGDPLGRRAWTQQQGH